MTNADEEKRLFERTQQLQRVIDAAVGAQKRARYELDWIQDKCQHNWGPVQYDPIYHEAYTTEGDPPGTMGVDWRGPVYVPASLDRKWHRTCKKCNLTQTTSRVTEESVAGSTPGTNAKTEVPDFGDRRGWH